jgi:hypothetical protein
MTSYKHAARRQSPCARGSWITLLAVAATVSGARAARAFNSEEHKVLVDLAVSRVVPDASIHLPFPTRFESFPISTLVASYTDAKRLAVGYASNNGLWDSRCESPAAPDPTPAAYDDHRLAVQDNSYWDSDHGSYNQIEGNINMWIPQNDLLQEDILWVSGYMDGNERTFSFGDLVSIYGDYRRTSFCVAGKCYLSDIPLSVIDFHRGTDCYGVWPLRICGYRPAPQRSDIYLKRIAAGLWPPFGCLGNAISNTAEDNEYSDAGWWGDEMMRIANTNDWHFSSAAVAWYVGLHRLALQYVNQARVDPLQWNIALHYEANALHSLTDLFCFGHIVTNRDETSHGVMTDRGLLTNAAYQWMQNVIRVGGGSRDGAGRVSTSGTLPAVADRSGLRNDFMPSYLGQGTWAIRGIQEHSYHNGFNASGAVVRNLHGDRFSIQGDGEVRHYSQADRDVIVEAVRISLQRLFDAYVRLEQGSTVAELGVAGSDYFDALERIPVFVESDPGHYFMGRWMRYAGALATITGTTVVPANFGSCQLPYISGGESLPTASVTPCTAFPEVTGVWVEGFTVHANRAGIALAWSLSPQAVAALDGIGVQRATDPRGPYENRSLGALQPSTSMLFVDSDVEAGGEYWYRLDLVSRDGTHTNAGPLRVVAGSAGALTTALSLPVLVAGGPVEIRFSLGPNHAPGRLDLYDIAGRHVRCIATNLIESGQYLRSWDRRDDFGVDVARGVYVIRLRAGTAGDSKKVVLVGG